MASGVRAWLSRVALVTLVMLPLACATPVRARIAVLPASGVSPWLSEIKSVKVAPYRGTFFHSSGMLMMDTPTLSSSFHEELREAIEQSLTAAGGRIGVSTAEDLEVVVEACSLTWTGNMGISSRAVLRVLLSMGQGDARRFTRAEGVCEEGGMMVRMASTAEPQFTRALEECCSQIVRSVPLETRRPEAEADSIVTGTCFAVAPDGWLVTAEHVVRDRQSVEVQMGGVSVAATVIARDRVGDLALLRVGVPTPDFLVIDSQWKTEIGKKVFALGYPAVGFLTQDIRYSDGTVSAERAIEGKPHLFQVSVPVQPGNSGGPLLSEASGALVGVVVSKASFEAFLEVVGTLPENITFAVQADRVRALLESAQIRPVEVGQPGLEKARKATFLLICK